MFLVKLRPCEKFYCFLLSASCLFTEWGSLFPDLRRNTDRSDSIQGNKRSSHLLKKTLAPFYVNSQGKHRAVASPELSCCLLTIPAYTQEYSSLSGIHLLLDS